MVYYSAWFTTALPTITINPIPIVTLYA